MNTPLYNELVKKYYLSRGLVPFSSPLEEIDWSGMIQYDFPVRQGPVDPTAGVYFNLKD